MMIEKRNVEIAIISDVHLGTYGCHAKEVLQYLRSIAPEKLILNGDIVDIWQFRKGYFPPHHMQVIKQITDMMVNGTEVIYLTGNHDDTLRKLSGLDIGSFKLLDKLVLIVDKKKVWIFHGDVFDVSMRYSKKLAKLGAVGYDLLILINRFINYFSVKMGKGKMSLSKKIKNSVKSAIKFMSNFEETLATLAIHQGYDYVICGHIHQPIIKEIKNSKGKVMYLNSGDWVENLTAIEYTNSEWTMYEYNNDAHALKFNSDTEQFDNIIVPASFSKELLLLKAQLN